MRIYKPKNELGQAILNEGQLVATSKTITKNLVDGAITLTDSDVSGIANWNVKNVQVTIGGQVMTFTAGVERTATGLIIRFADASEAGRLEFSDAVISLQLVDSQGVSSNEVVEEITIDVLIKEALSTGDNTKVDDYVDDVIAGGSKEEIQSVGAKLASSGIEEYTLAGAKTGDEVVSLMTGNMGAFSSPIASLNGDRLVLNDPNFSYNMMTLEDAWNKNIYRGLFELSNITSFDASISSLTDGYQMFERCYSLTSFTSELPNLKYGKYMFASGPIESWNVDIPSLTDGGCMFMSCFNLTYFTSELPNLTEGRGMFSDCTSLTYCEPKNCKNSTALQDIIDSLPTYDKADGSHMILFSTGNEELNDELTINALMKGWGVGTDATDAYYYYGSGETNPWYDLVDGQGMFCGDSSLREWHYDMPNLVNGEDMFFGCFNLTSFTSDLPSLANGQFMFYECSNLASFTSNLSSLTNAFDMFDGCNSLTYCEPKNCSNSYALEQIINSLPSYNKADGTHMILFSTGNDETNKKLTATALLKGWGVGTEDMNDSYYYYGSGRASDNPYYELVDGSYKFSYDGSLTEWNYDMPNLTNGSWMFKDCSNLTTFTSDLSSLTSGRSMFDGCTNLTYFESVISSLEDGCSMFFGCFNLSSFNSELPSLTDGRCMFGGCSKLASFTSDLPSLTNGDWMFSGCSNLTTFTSDLSSLTNGESMFRNCRSLATFTSDLPNLEYGEYMFASGPIESWYIDLPKLTDGYKMFENCSNLTSFESDLPFLRDGVDMFYGCKLDLASVQNIAETINAHNSNLTLGLGGNLTLGLGCTRSTFDDHSTGWYDAVEAIKSKGWKVSVYYNC